MQLPWFTTSNVKTISFHLADDANYEYYVLDCNIKSNKNKIGGVLISGSISGKTIELRYWIAELD